MAGRLAPNTLARPRLVGAGDALRGRQIANSLSYPPGLHAPAIGPGIPALWRQQRRVWFPLIVADLCY
jgi:hypothetical protein